MDCSPAKPNTTNKTPFPPRACTYTYTYNEYEYVSETRRNYTTAIIVSIFVTIGIVVVVSILMAMFSCWLSGTYIGTTDLFVLKLVIIDFCNKCGC